MDDWNQARLQRFIDDQVQEHLQLDYKEAAALDKRNQKRIEDITKDVSAFANSAGGVIIYGMKEDQSLKIPTEIDPVDIGQITHETLAQIIGIIQPRLVELVRIHPVIVDDDPRKVVYIVEIDQGFTAYQAKDKKYYKRNNGISEAMYGYEIRDVMSRNTHPRISLEFQFEMLTEDVIEEILSEDDGAVRRSINLDVYAYNEGAVFAQYVVARVLIPNVIFSSPSNSPIETIENIAYRSFSLRNERKEYDLTPNLRGGFTRSEKYTGSYDPVLPRNSVFLSTIHDVGNFDISDHKELQIQWVVFADNAQPITGKIRIADIEITEMDITD